MPARTQSAERAAIDPVRAYLDDIGRHQLLTKEDEAALAVRIENGTKARARLDEGNVTPAERRKLRAQVADGEAATERFVQANLRLVVSIAKKYQRVDGLELLDLIQEGNLGLIHAVEKFDWRKGFKFSTYATWWVRQAIQRGMANTADTIRVPVHASDQRRLLTRARAELRDRLGRRPSEDELVEATGLTLEQVRAASRIPSASVSLDAAITDDTDTGLVDLVPDQAVDVEGDAVTAVSSRDIDSVLDCLNEREARILRLRFGFDRGEVRTLEEVAEHFDLTRERIRQIEARALSKLRHPATAALVRTG
jgi:RNA polymerase sigma factor (sigma-70 family)